MTESSAESPTELADPPARARAFVAWLRDGKFAQAEKQLDATMLGALPAAKLAELWSGLGAQVGALKSIEGATAASEGGYATVRVHCKFERAPLDVKLAFDKQGKVAGLFFLPPVAPYSDPAYVDREKFDERELLFGQEPWVLPATLTMPKTPGPVPAVVLVHGSGPNDRDESVGANKPFKDLAGGLASRGIAVLRYDKRTKVHGAKLGDLSNFTVDDEAVDDAVQAVLLLSKTAGIDPKRIVVVGHSLGGTLAPRIGNKSKEVAALVLLAGATRKIPDMMIEQLSYIASLDGRTAPEENEQIEKIKAAQLRIREIEAGKPALPNEVVLGAGAAYWKDLAQYDPLAMAKSLKRPILVLQGGRDYQVTEVDYRAWQQALRKSPGFSAKLYPKLNHLFATGEGKSTPDEYGERTPVDAEVVADVASFVKTLK